MEYMFGSMGTKGGIVLYHIGYGGYGIALGCLTINGVTNCYQLKCWLTNVGLVTKLDCGRICYTCTLTCVTNMLGITCCKEVTRFYFNNRLSLLSTLHAISISNFKSLSFWNEQRSWVWLIILWACCLNQCPTASILWSYRFPNKYLTIF
jgi:hypothetical protein